VVRADDTGFTAEVLTVDHFGNVQLAAPGALLDRLPERVRVAGRAAVRGSTFGDAPPGGLVAYVDSAGLVALAVNTGRAVDLLGVRPGEVVTVSAG
jgi:S-adenosylmethionine hydrolase